MKTILWICAFVAFGIYAHAQSVEDYFQYLGMTSDQIEATGEFTATTSSDWSSDKGVVLELRKVGDTKRVVVISVYTENADFEKTYTRRSWEGTPFAGTLPLGLNSTMNLKEANKVLKKQDGVEVFVADKKQRIITGHWDIPTPMDDIDYGRKIVRIDGQMGMERGLWIKMHFSNGSGEPMTQMTIDAVR